MSSAIRIVTFRAPGLTPSLVQEIHQAKKPLVLVPESSTFACEKEIIRHSESSGFIGLHVFSPSSLVDEVADLAGNGDRTFISEDGQTMIMSQLLHHNREMLSYYKDAVSQPFLPGKIARQINALSQAGMYPAYLEKYTPKSRRTQGKFHDLSNIWTSYGQWEQKGYCDSATQWKQMLDKLPLSGLLEGATLLIYGFDDITSDLVSLAKTARELAQEVVIGLVCDHHAPDKQIFLAAASSLRAFIFHLTQEKVPFVEKRYEESPEMDPGIAFVEKTLFAYGSFASEKIIRTRQTDYVIRNDPDEEKTKAVQALQQEQIPDLSRVKMYYARNSYIECLHACQTLIGWHRQGIAWDDMAVITCEQDTLPSLLSLTLRAAGIPFNSQGDEPILRTPYARYFFSLLRILRLRFRMDDVIRMAKTGLAGLDETTVMDLENYARSHGIDRRRWTIPFPLPEKNPEPVEALEKVRKGLIEPLIALRASLLRQCSGKNAATLLFTYITSQGVYDRLLQLEKQYYEAGDEVAIDRNRMTWNAINELLDQVASFIGDEPLPLEDLCHMLEASLSAKQLHLIPQKNNAVTLSGPKTTFSSGIPCVYVMGLQENAAPDPSDLISEIEKHDLEQFILHDRTTPKELKPYGRIGLSQMDLAAKEKQNVYRSVSLAKDQLVLSCSSAKPDGSILKPSAAFRKLARFIHEIAPENYAGGLLQDGLSPFAPGFALERLATLLRARQNGRKDFLSSSDPSDLQWKNAMSVLYHEETWNPRVRSILQSLHVTAKTSGISPDQAKSLLLSEGMSISRIQTHMRCPYMDFLQSGLRLTPAGIFQFEDHERGTFYHAVLARFLHDAALLPGWPNLSEKDQNRLLNHILHEETRPWENSVLGSDSLHRFQAAEIVRSVRTSIESIMRSFRHDNHFLPYGLEIGFGSSGNQNGIHFPALTLELSDGYQVGFSGIIDRVDTVVLPDGRKFFMVIDNKSSPRDLKQNSIDAGLQLQLPLYLLAAQQGMEGYLPAGGVYQPIRDVLVSTEDPQKILAEIDKELQTSGMILDDADVLAAAAPVKDARKTLTNDVISRVSSEDMAAVEKHAIHIILSATEDIRKGNTSPAPVKDGQKSPCEFCDYTLPCPLDRHMPGGKVLEVSHRSRPILP